MFPCFLLQLACSDDHASAEPKVLGQDDTRPSDHVGLCCSTWLHNQTFIIVPLIYMHWLLLLCSPSIAKSHLFLDQNHFLINMCHSSLLYFDDCAIILHLLLSSHASSYAAACCFASNLLFDIEESNNN
jgi:hypothetical protein